MLLDESEQQQSSNSSHCPSTNLTNILLRKDEFSEINANMTKTLHLNTPEQGMSGIDIDDDFDDDDDNNENKLLNKQPLIERLQTQLIDNQIRRTQPRDYARILRESNTPAYWYKPPPTNRSVYFYDPNYQKCVQQRSYSPQRIKSNICSILPQPLRIPERSANHSKFAQNNSFPHTPRIKYMLNLYNTAINYQQEKQRLNQNYHSTSSHVSQQHPSPPSRLQSIPTLPRIHTSKQRNVQNSDLSDIIDKDHRSIPSELRKKN